MNIPYSICDLLKGEKKKAPVLGSITVKLKAINPGVGMHSKMFA